MEAEVDRSTVRAFVGDIRARRDELVGAVVDDGWPEPMARAGLSMHEDTWRVDRLADAIRRELEPVVSSPDHRVVWPRRVHHLWPALPGAGITPVLVGMLLGLDQRVRPSSRGLAFARRVAEFGNFGLIEPGDEEWDEAPVVVVSGSDETVEAVRDRMSGRGRVVGYGHRVSFAVVDDSAGRLVFDEVAPEIAKDIVMWHQRGCFSARAVLFCGTDRRRRAFAESLAGAVAGLEEKWQARRPGDETLGERAQRLGVARMKNEVFCKGVGYVRCRDAPFDGRLEAIHSVTVHAVEGPEAIGGAVSVGPGDLQAAALAGGDERRDAWIEALGRLGVTRVSPVGRLQVPPPEWWHDGRPNALGLGRILTAK